jgi:hypothetical protein
MEAWVWIICNASFADHTVFNRGRKMTLKRGDLLGAWAFLAHTWNWSAKTVRSWVEKLIEDNMLQKRATEAQRERSLVADGANEAEAETFYGNQSSILSVVNYWRFQFDGYEEGQPRGNQKGNQLGAQLGNQFEELSASRIADKYILQQQQGQPLGQPEGQPKGQHITRDIDNNVSSRARRAKKTEARSAEKALELDQAILAYNAAAATHDFSKIENFSPARAKSLEKRLVEIGGVDKFKLALSAIPLNRFLMGQVPPKNGQAPFRLTFERLLSTGSGLGDVLAGLLDQASTGQESIIGPNGKRWGWWRGSESNLKALSPDDWRKALDHHRPNGTWPWWHLTAPPGHPECLVHPDVVAERNLVARYEGRITHD